MLVRAFLFIKGEGKMKKILILTTAIIFLSVCAYAGINEGMVAYYRLTVMQKMQVAMEIMVWFMAQL